MWPAYVINLAANTRRMEQSARQLGAQAIAWRRIEGVDGWALSAGEVGRVYDRQRNARRANNGSYVGCFKMPIALWRSASAIA